MKNDLMLEAYVSARWLFEADPAYWGILGRIRAYFDRRRAERFDEMTSAACEDIMSEVYWSSPLPEELYRQYVEEHLKRCSFADAMMRLIDARGLDPSDVYARAGIDRRLFSKIRTHREYRPAKKTVLALCIGMGLSLAESKDLLQYCGFCLSDRILTDVVVEYFLANGIHDICRVNQALAGYGLPPLV